MRASSHRCPAPCQAKRSRLCRPELEAKNTARPIFQLQNRFWPGVAWVAWGQTLVPFCSAFHAYNTSQPQHPCKDLSSFPGLPHMAWPLEAKKMCSSSAEPSWRPLPGQLEGGPLTCHPPTLPREWMHPYLSFLSPRSHWTKLSTYSCAC